MGVHYPRNLIGRIRSARLVPVTIAVGSDICWQGGVTVGEQLSLLATLQEMERRHPVDSLPPAVIRGDAEDDTPLMPSVPAQAQARQAATVPHAAPIKPTTNSTGAAHAAPAKAK